MKFRILKDRFGVYTIQRRLFGFLWIDHKHLDLDSALSWRFDSEAEALRAIEHYCHRIRRNKIKPIVVKEISCEEIA